MDVTFDPAKDAANKRKHGLSLGRAGDFDIDTAFFVQDAAQDYGEVRYNAIGWLDARLHCFTFAIREGRVRAISLRKATRQEEKLYAEAY